MVVYTVTRPAIPPMPNVTLAGSDCPGRPAPCTKAWEEKGRIWLNEEDDKGKEYLETAIC